MKRLIVAFAFLTKLPLPRVSSGPEDFAAAIRLYPLVGLAIGAAVAAACWIGGRIDPWLGALAGLALWIGITGALHLDGLADVADGLGAAHGARSRLLEVMADPHVGSFGVVALTMQIAVKLVLLRLLAGEPIAVALIPFAARIGPLCWARWLAPLKASGVGAAVAGAVRIRDIAGWTMLFAVTVPFAPAMLAAPLLVLLFAWWAARRIGGMTGDVHGAGIELVETGLLLAALVVARL